MSADPIPGRPAWPSGTGRRVRDLVADLLLGARLTVAGRRSGWLRLVLISVGIAVATTILLFAASIGHIRAAQQARAEAAVPDRTVIDGVDPLYLSSGGLRAHFRDRAIGVVYLRAGGPAAPIPPGLDRIPGPGEAIVSPALAELLASPEGAELRGRYPDRIVGEISRQGLFDGPRSMLIYRGSADLVGGEAYYRFGVPFGPTEPIPPLLWALLVVGTVVLLFPVLILVATISRLSDAERDRRLAAMRLVGAGTVQVRRVAAGEALMGALTGLLLGGILFLAARPLVERPELGDAAAYAGGYPFTADVVPAWPFVVLIALTIPLVTVLTALIALRRTIVDPLGTTRQVTPPQPKLLWRLVPAGLAAALLGYLVVAGEDLTYERPSATPVLAIGCALALLAVPALLPWLVRRAVRRPVDRTVALQLATRRLQLTSGSASRALAGLAVVLAGAISLTALFFASQDEYESDSDLAGAVVRLAPGDPAPTELMNAAATVPGAEPVDNFRALWLQDADGTTHVLTVRPCAELVRSGRLTSCTDGRMYQTGDAYTGRTFTVHAPDGPPTGRTFRVPASVGTARPAFNDPDSGLYATPAAVADLPPEAFSYQIVVRVAPDEPVVDRMSDVLAPLAWRAGITTVAGLDAANADTQRYFSIRRGLIGGTILTLTLAGIALLVTCLQQIHDSRRPLAALAATGVPRGVLARSLAWQNAGPAVIAVLLADVGGVLLAGFLLRIAQRPFEVDWGTVGVLSAITLAVVAVVTLLTLPTVRLVTRPVGLRTE